MLIAVRKSLLVALYGAMVACANPSAADVARAQAARAGDLEKLQFHAPQPAAVQGFQTVDGAPLDLRDWRGKYVLVNFWATWCAPCKKEMPSLDRLNAQMGGATFEVLTIATGRNDPTAMARFFETAGVTTLPLHRDPEFALADGLGVRGLPYTILLDPQGQIIARMVGGAEWDSDAAYAVIEALIAKGEG